MKARWTLALLLVFAALTIAPSASACGPYEMECQIDPAGLDLYDEAKLRFIAHEQAQQIKSKVPHYEYKTIDACTTGGILYGTEDCLTNKIVTMCPPSEGPMVEILQRLVNPDGTVAKDWAALALTCRGNEVPGAAKRPTMAMIVDAFHHTSWAKASIGFQPKGYLTLVSLEFNPRRSLGFRLVSRLASAR